MTKPMTKENYVNSYYFLLLENVQYSPFKHAALLLRSGNLKKGYIQKKYNSILKMYTLKINFLYSTYIYHLKYKFIFRR